MSRAALALCLALLLPAGARAQQVDQDSAQQLQDDLRSWLVGLLGPNAEAVGQRLHVIPANDHFRVVVPFTGAAHDLAVKADVRRLPDGTWSVQSLELPSAAHLTLPMPEPGAAPGTKVPTRFDLHIGSQNSHALIDPALTVPSHLDIDVGDVGLDTDNSRQHQEQHIDRYTVRATLRPHDGKLDLVEQGTLLGWRTASRVGNKPAVGFGADRIDAHGQIDGIDPVHARTLLAAVSGLIATLPPAAEAQHGNLALSPAARAGLRLLIESLRGVVTDAHGEETIDGMHIAVAGRGEATIRHMAFGIAGAAPNGMLHATMDIEVDGLAAQNMTPQAMALVPRHVLLRPSVAGLPMAELTKLALAATEPHVDPGQLLADAEALLAHGGVTVGVDALDLAIGPATLHGRGQVLLTSTDDYDARAHVTATGLDTLMQQAASNPALQRALPVLAMARGFARQEGDHLVWDIAAGPSGLTVNGVPLGGTGSEPPHQPDKR